jgi:exosortase
MSTDFSMPTSPKELSSRLDYESTPLLRSDRLTEWHLIGAVIVAALGVLVTRNAWAEIYHIAYNDEEWSHIFIVPLVAGYLIWVRRVRFRHCKPSGTIIGPITIIAGWIFYEWGFHNGIQSFWHGGAVLIVLGCALSVLGKNVLFRFMPAVLVLVFLVPVPGMIRQKIALPLQAWTAQVSQVILELLGQPAEVSGNTLIINGQQVVVAEACNGMRMVFALVLVVFAFAFGMPLRNSVRFLLLLASPLAAIACNVIRTVPTVYLYGYATNDIATKFHDYAGWAMLPVAFLMLYAIIKVLRWAQLPVTRYTLASQGQ